MRRLRACLAHTRPGGWGHRPGQLCGSAVRRLDAERTKAAKAVRIRGRVTSPVRTRKYGPLAQNRRNGAPQGDALSDLTSPRTRCRKRDDTKVRLAALHAPQISRGRTKAHLARCARANAHAFRWREWSKPTRACCLKIESVTRRATDALSASPPTDYGRATWLRTGPCRPLRSGAPAA
ncbi:hypothetical protein HMPREF9695_00179 [Afipia broomeae ATCC 49717]|uniref:Uncharacterized protein n=1 Tax=Afipia broomeae ATCC 49717 TaxID=883078 RepID=K8PEK6_9BRAD|nr:hypothetical protein HMPREF9695_00179 [Afipia broomeae ATCC 49717]